MMDMTNNQQDSKPATITAQQFVEQGYAEMVKRGECVVMDGDKTIICTMPEQILDHVWFQVAQGSSRFNKGYDRYSLFSVKWLSQPAQDADEWVDLAPSGKVWLAEMLTDRVQQVMPFESREDGQEWLDDQLKQYHPEHTNDQWFMSESGSALTWYGTNDLSLTLVEIQKATKAPAQDATAGDVDYQVEVYPGVDNEGYDIHSRGQGMGWRADVRNAYMWALGIANDNITTLQADNATLRQRAERAEGEARRLRSALQVIVDYPDVESDMDVWHIVNGMVLQAHVALEAASDGKKG